MLKYRSYQQLYQDIVAHVLPKLSDIYGIVGVPRSGMIPATMIATALQLPLAQLGAPFAEGRRCRLYPVPKGKKVLLVDDSVYGGASMARAKAQALSTVFYPKEVVTCGIYCSKADAVDVVGVVLPGPRMFEWNMWGIEMTKHFMCDLDGVICQDPRVFDDDSEKYQRALVEAAPKLLPKVPVAAICTNRIRRWSKITGEWLRKHGVQYGKLIMQPYPSAALRRRHSDPAKYKAHHYNNSDATLFVESHDAIAARMKQFTEKPVFSVESGKVL